MQILILNQSTYPYDMGVPKSLRNNASLTILMILCTLCAASKALFSDEKFKSQPKGIDLQAVRARYEQWVQKHGRNYITSSEKEHRFQIYHSNLAFIDEVNSRNLSFKLSDNRFADMTNEEYRQTVLGLQPGLQEKTRFFRYDVNGDLPNEVDWRNNGCVTPVKDQGSCGSCWAFSTVASLESIYQIKTGTLISLSEQELIDCDVHNGNQGCSGGLMENAFKFVKTNGLTTEENYPYRGQNNECDSDKLGEPVVMITGYETVPENDEESLRAAAAHQPVSAAVDAGSREFQHYSTGIFRDLCGTKLNHSVAVVGYGQKSDGKYWLLKNSWGTRWGESGYVRLLRGSEKVTGECGIAMMASYPVMD